MAWALAVLCFTGRGYYVETEIAQEESEWLRQKAKETVSEQTACSIPAVSFQWNAAPWIIFGALSSRFSFIEITYDEKQRMAAVYIIVL
jgi:uncharacterized iron-regulated membrane protein